MKKQRGDKYLNNLLKLEVQNKLDPKSMEKTQLGMGESHFLTDKVTFHSYSLMVCMEIEVKDFLSPHASHVIASFPTYLGT